MSKAVKRILMPRNVEGSAGRLAGAVEQLRGPVGARHLCCNLCLGSSTGYPPPPLYVLFRIHRRAADLARPPTWREVAPLMKNGLLLSTRSLLAMGMLMWATRLIAGFGAVGLAGASCWPAVRCAP